MPRLSRKSKRAKTEWTQLHVTALLRGFDCFHVFGHDDDAETIERMSHAWEQLADVILPEFIAEHPGRRPWAWWRFDAPAPRRLLVKPEDTGWHPMGEATSFGRHQLFQPITGHDMPYGIFPPISDMYEPEHEYLRRHRLLTPEEREALRGTTSAT
jgi:hypothetical protein